MNLNYKDTKLNNIFYNTSFINLMKVSNNEDFEVFEGEDYKYFQYVMKINVLSFLKGKLLLKFNVVGLPISLSEKGYIGEINSIINNCKKNKGITFIINMDEKLENLGLPVGNTLYNCEFYNNFKSFDDYLSTLKSNYRRRINVALKKGKHLKCVKINNDDFTDEIYQLYLNTYNNSEYKLECLTKEFFINANGEINVFYINNKPVAFFITKVEDNALNFLFGGFDYSKRDELDLYYNVLLKIIQIGIKNGYQVINLGQTAETSKMRLGAVLKPKYFCIITKSKVLNYILLKSCKFFEYKYSKTSYSVYKS